MCAVLSGLFIGGNNGWPPQANKQKSVSLTGGWARGDDSKQYGYYTLSIRLDMSHDMRKYVFGV